MDQTPSPTPISPAPSTLVRPRTWIRWVCGIVAVSAVLAIATFVYFSQTRSVTRPVEVTNVSRIVVPREQAEQPFTFVPEKTDVAGVAPDSRFTVTAKPGVSMNGVMRALKITPATDVTVDRAGSQEYVITPKQALKPGQVYRFELATSIQNTDGSAEQRDFTWAIQTKEVFRVLSAVPGDQSAGVPVDTAIEVTMSQIGWEDPAAFFSIEPKTDGHFETHGRSLVFLPNKPLQPGQIYTVTYKKGWKIANSDRVLTDDYVTRFETADPRSQTSFIQVRPSGRFFEGVPGKESFVQAYANDYGSTSFQNGLTATGYTLSSEQAKDLIAKMEQIPLWASETRSSENLYKAFAKQSAFQASVSLEQRSSSNQTFIRLPAQTAGTYLVRLAPSSTTSNDQPASWFVLQLTKLATYAMVDDLQTLVWVMNMETQLPMANVTIRYGSTQEITDEQGVARLPTPAPLVSTSTAPEDSFVILEAGSSADTSALIPLERSGWQWGYAYGPQVDSNAHTIGYIYPDRPLFRNSDSMSFFGLMQDRDTHHAAEHVTVQLKRFGYINYGTYREKVYAEVPVETDASGFFKGTLTWDALSSGAYQLIVTRDGKSIVSRGIEIRDIVKPALTLDILPTRSAVYAGEKIEGQVIARLLDGTPLSHQKISVQHQGQTVSDSVELETDDSGIATYSFVSKRSPCDPKDRNAYCQTVWTDTIEVHPVDAEEAQISASMYVSVWSAHVSPEVDVITVGDQADVSVLVRRVDLRMADNGQVDRVVTEPMPNSKVQLHVFEDQWEQVQTGMYYDAFQKKAVPKYRYDFHEKELQAPIVMTDAQGKAIFHFPMKDGVTYRVAGAAVDEFGAEAPVMTNFAKGWYTPGSPEDQGISLDPIARHEQAGYVRNEEVTVGFFQGHKKMANTVQPAFLYVEASRGLRSVTVSNQSSYTFRFRDELIPNATIYGIRFSPEDGFTETNFLATYDARERGLKMTLTTDKQRYAPGEKVTATIEVKTLDGKPVPGANIAVGAVDKALLLMSYNNDYRERPTDYIYGWVGSGVIMTRASHVPAGTSSPGGGGAEMGGGGGEPVRRNFKDTAAFDVLTAGADGTAQLSFTAPDNITTWRLTAVGVTGDLFGGSTQIEVPVTKLVFIDAVIPQTVLSADAPVLKMRVFGSGLRLGEAVGVTVDAPSMNMSNVMVTGTAGMSMYVPLPKLVSGDHVFIFRVKGASGSDALERHVRVVDSRLFRNEAVTLELVKGATLPDMGDVREVELSFVSRTQSRYLQRILGLAGQWSARLESRVGANIARTLLRSIFHRQDIDAPVPLLEYQHGSGGVAVLPYATEDVETSSKIALTNPEAVDRSRLASYLWSIADQGATVTREMQIRALSGLAALGEPVLLRLQGVAQRADLEWREQIAVGRGLEAAGDQQTAQMILDALLKKSELHDGLRELVVSKDRRDTFEATAEVSVLAAALHDPSAMEFDAFLDKNWNDDVLTDLDRAAFLQQMVSMLPSGDVKIRYRIGNDFQETAIKDGEIQTIMLTSSEAKAFVIDQVAGEGGAVFIRRVAGQPTASPLVSLTRQYRQENSVVSTSFAEGQTVSVTLTPTWQPRAQDGCYVVQDIAPAGLVPYQSVIFGYMNDQPWYPFDIDGNVVRFVVCKGDQRSITYRLRVVSRGTYHTEPAIMQSIEAPSIATVTDGATVTIK